MSTSSPSVTDRIASALRDDILRGRYRAGERLPSERELAERFETHRGAAREALKKLEQLGIAQIRPGGARAAPIEDASLDIVQYLVDLDAAPDPELFDRIFEVFGGLFAHAARLGAERADEGERARIAEILQILMEDDLPVAEEHERIRELSDLFVEASRNMVLALVRNGLHFEFVERIEGHQALLRPPDDERRGLLEAIARAVADQDGPAAAEAAYDLTVAVRRHAVEILEAERDRQSPRRAGGVPR